MDADAYFRAVADAIGRARRSVSILSWDIDSRTGLAGGGADDDAHRLGGVLHAALERNPELTIRVLNWDFALIYAFEREMLARLRPDWTTHPRLQLRFDGTHPVGACHHQKVVVVDDAIAFAGGLDICDRRWDTPAHDPNDARRVDLGGTPYAPFHDVQMLVDGAAARALGDLARRRWRDATGERLPPTRTVHDPWPAGVRPDFTDVAVGISRTVPDTEASRAVREVETLFLDAIRAAKRWIYAENQYLTSTVIADALAARLEEQDGPEVLLVVPREGCGWLEEQTMSMRRKGIVERLEASDRHGRLRVYAPVVAGDVVVNVHSKVTIVDDVQLRVGSANLSNRSMAVDTECDLVIDGDDAATRAGIARIRARLLGDHLGRSPDEVAAAMEAEGSLLRAVERLRGGSHTLMPLPATPPGWLDGLPPEADVFDPAEPIDVGQLLGRFLPLPLEAPTAPPWWRTAANTASFLVGLLGRSIGVGSRADDRGPHG